MNIINTVITKIVTSKNQELSQSLVRAGLVVVVSAYLFGYYSIYPEKEVIMPFVWAVIIYFVYSICLVVHTLLYTQFIPIRHYFTIVFDMALLAVGMYAGDLASAFFYGGYYWLILGNGLRFGQRSLHISVALAIISFTIVISTTSFWQEHIVLGLGLMIWLFLLPSYIGKLIREKESALEQAQYADHAKGRFITNMSHELRTPLNGIIGYSQMIYEEEINLSEAKECSVKIDKSAQHLLSLINELLDMASIDSGKMTINISEINISTLMSEIISLVEPIANKHKINLHFDTFSNDSVLADKLRLKQVLVNLISNAIKYNNENGDVTVSYTIVNNTITIKVSDTGPGLSKEEQDHVFNPFERLTVDSAEVEGAGIGLVITKNLIKMMGGEIGVESEKHKGSCFWIKLPVVNKK